MRFPATVVMKITNRKTGASSHCSVYFKNKGTRICMASAKSICEGQQKIDLSPFLVNNVLE
jgi:hypothetical protein